MNDTGIRLALAITWFTTGANFVGFKIAVTAFPPFLMMALRLGLAGLVLVVLLLLAARLRPLPNLRQWRDAGIAGFLFLVLGQGLIVAGVVHTTAGHAALLAATAPLMTTMVAWLLLGRRPGGRGFLGVMMGFFGLLLLILPDAQTSSDLAGSALILVGTFAWGAAMLHAERASRPENTMVATLLQMIPASAMLLGLSLAAGEFDDFRFKAVSPEAWSALAFLVLAGSLLGYSAFVWMLPHVPAAMANSFFYVGPVITLGLGWLLLGETVRLRDLAGAVITLTGVALMVSSRNPAPRR